MDTALDGALLTRARAELSPEGWSPENHEKLARLIARWSIHAPARGHATPYAVFDADNTLWAGDLGETALVHLARGLRLSPRLPELLPEALTVRAQGDRPAGRLFPAARLAEAWAALEAAAGPRGLDGFEERDLAPGGRLHGSDAFANAWAVYQGVVVATHDLLDENVGKVAFDAAHGEPVAERFDPTVRAFVAARAAAGDPVLRPLARPDGAGGWDLIFPRILDSGPGQAALARAGRLGAYTQIAAWTALDRRPDELRALALELWERGAGAIAPCPVVYPIDAPDAAAPRPLDFYAPRARFAAGASPAPGLHLGRAAMTRGLRLRPPMVDLIGRLSAHGIRPLVVSASQRDLVEAVVCRHYGVEPGCTVGMLHALEGGRYRGSLLPPVPFRSGKVHAAAELATRLGADGARGPVLAAGDANTDLELLACSADARLFFDRGARPLMELADWLRARGQERSTLVQRPFEPDAP